MLVHLLEYFPHRVNVTEVAVWWSSYFAQLWRCKVRLCIRYCPAKVDQYWLTSPNQDIICPYISMDYSFGLELAQDVQAVLEEDMQSKATPRK